VSETEAKINFPDINDNYTLIDFKNFDSKCEKILSDDLRQYSDNIRYRLPIPDYGINIEAAPEALPVEAPPWFVNIVSKILQEKHLEHLFNQEPSSSTVKYLKKFGIWSETELNKSSEIDSEQIRENNKREPFEHYTDENGELWQSYLLY